MFNSQLNIYYAKFIGTVTLESIIEFINLTVVKASEFNCNNLVHDMTEAKFQLNFIEEHTLFKKMLRSTHLTCLHKVAVIVDYYDDNGQVDYTDEKVSEKRTEFANIVGFNYGQKVWKFFEKYDDGIEWLNNHKKEIQPSIEIRQLQKDLVDLGLVD